MQTALAHMDFHAAKALLDWQIELGADEPIGEAPVNRYEIALVRITAEYHQAMARIDALLGRAGGDR